MSEPKDTPGAYLGASIARLELSTRSANCLKKLNVITISDLIQFTPQQLLKRRNFGRTSLQDIESALRRLGLALAGPYGEPLPIPPSQRQPSSPPTGSDVLIEDLSLSVRTGRCLREMGCVSLSDIASLTERQLLAHHTFGRKCLSEVTAALDRHGLTLNSGPPSTAPEIDFDSASLIEQATLCKPVDNLCFSARPDTALRKLGIHFVAELIQLSEPFLLRQKNLGRTSVREIAEKLSTVHLSLGSVVSNWSTAKARKVTEVLRHSERDTEATGGKGDPSIHTELAFLVEPAGSSRNQAIAARALGWDGSPPSTYAEIGQKYGISRERVRQICARIWRKWKRRRAFVPKLTHCLKSLRCWLPADVATIESRLSEHGFTKKAFSLAGLLEAMQTAALNPSIDIVSEHGAPFAVPASLVHTFKAIIQQARRYGVTTVQRIRARLEEDGHSGLEDSYLRKVVSADRTTEWLDESQGWIWSKEHTYSPVINQIRGVLSVSPSIPLSELRRAIRRPRRLQELGMPKHVLMELCRRLPWCRFEGDSVVAVGDISPSQDQEELTAFKIAAVLKKHGPILSREHLRKYAAEQGVSGSAFSVRLSYSSLVKKLGRGLYALVGTPVPDDQKLPLYQRRTHFRLITDYGLAPDGRAWILYQLSPNMIQKGFFSVPPEIHSSFQGEFKITDSHGLPCGDLAIKGDDGGGLKPFFNVKGVDEEDFLLLLFTPGSRTLVGYVGDEELAHKCQEGNVLELGKERLEEHDRESDAGSTPDWLNDFLES